MNSEQTWLVDRLFNTFDRDTIGEAFAGNHFDGVNGVDALWKLVLQEASERIESSSEDAAVAFNIRSTSWPQLCRCRLAAYELQQREIGHEPIREDLESLAELGNMLDMELGETALDCFYEDNPWNDDDLTDKEAQVVMMLRISEFDFDTEIIEEVGDPGIFSERLQDYGDVERAVRASHFDPDVPASLLEYTKPAGDWGNLDPENIEGDNCQYCHDLLWQIDHCEVGETWADNKGKPRDAIHVPSEDDYEWNDGRINNGDVLCGDCLDQWKSRSVDYVRVGEEGRSAKVKSGTTMVGDMSEDGDIFESMQDAFERDPFFREITDGSCSPDDYIDIHPNENVGNPEAQELLLDMLNEGEATIEDVEEVIDNGTFYIVHNPPMEKVIRVKRSDFDSIRSAKSTLERAPSIVGSD